jgi:hypothetical protein
MHEMGSNAARMTMQDGELVGRTYKKGTRNAKLTTFRQLMELFNQKPEQNAVPILRDVKEVMERLAKANPKSAIAIEADRTIMDEAEGAVAGADEDDDEEMSSSPVAKSKAGAKVRQRDKNSALKNVTPTYGNKLSDMLSTLRACKVFQDILGSDDVIKYQGTYGEGEMGLNATLAANSEVQGNKTNNDIQAIPAYDLIKFYLPKIKDKLGADSMSYLTVFLQTKLLGLRDNLSGVEIRADDGGLYDRTIGESSRKEWYNKASGRLYISHFKTNKSRLGTTYDFALKDIPELKKAIDHTLRPAHP